jgi:hypothetical protein
MASLLLEGYIKIKKTLNGSWITLPTPKEDGVTYEIQTIVDDARNSAGNVIGNPVGTDKIKLNIEYPPLSDDELHQVMSIFDRDQNGSFFVYVNFYDPRIQQRVTRYMYVGDRSFQPWIIDNPQLGTPRKWINCQCNLIEC